MPADDLTDPAPATTFAHLDATTVLSRGIAELGIYPAVDPLDSTSRIMDPNIVGHEHYDIARSTQKILQVSLKLHVLLVLFDTEVHSFLLYKRLILNYQLCSVPLVLFAANCLDFLF